MQAAHLLKLIGNADEFRLAPLSAQTKITEATIIKSFAHAEPIALPIEANEWHQYNVQCIGFYVAIAVWDRFHDAIVVGQHRVAMTPACKPKSAGVEWM